MNRRIPHVLTLIAIVVGCAVAHVPLAQAQPQGTALLATIRAAHHAAGFDRVVFDFSDNRLPARYTVRYVDRLVGCGSGLPIPVAGNAILEVRFTPAAAHDARGTTFVPLQLGFDQTWNAYGTVSACDFEAQLAYGIVLGRRVDGIRHFTLTNPARVVVDIPTPFRTVLVHDYFVKQQNFIVGQAPYVESVWRRVPPPAVAAGALQRLFTHLTDRERDRGLLFVNSGATGFTQLSISNGIARVHLTGGCESGGSTLTIADQIIPTLKQFATVQYVKIYDPSGQTQQPGGNVDSIPACLEP